MKAEGNKPSGSDDPRQQAGDWFARLRAPGCTDIERAAFKRWLNDSATHLTAYRELEDLWTRLEPLKTHSPVIAVQIRGALRRRVAPLRRINPAMRRRVWRMAAAAVLVAAVGVLVMHPLTPRSLPLPWNAPAGSGERFVTATAEQRRITLTDGSEVLLDAESVLRVRYDDAIRYLALERGQAQFKVSKDAQRPFVVKAGEGAVRAIGTEFQVRVDSQAVLVTLLEGKVSVDVPGVLGGLLQAPRSETLVAGQQVRYAHDKKMQAKQPADVEVAQAWTQGDLVFKKWPLDELVAEMNRHTDVKIRIDDPTLRDLKVNGRFRAGDQQSLILALRHQWAIQALPAGDAEIVLRRTAAAS